MSSLDPFNSSNHDYLRQGTVQRYTNGPPGTA